MIKKILVWIKNMLTSPRFKAFYWSTGTMAFAGLLDLILQDLTAWNPNSTITVVAGLVFAQITKYIYNIQHNKVKV